MPNFIQIQPNATGLKIDTSELIVGANTVERQNICVADPASALAVDANKTKGLQGNYAIATQDFKDTGRTSICFTIFNFNFSATEVLNTFSTYKGGNAVVSNSNYTVTTGKTLRLQGMYFWGTNSSAGNGVVFLIRGNSSGAATTSSNVLIMLPMVMSGWLATQPTIFPDGFEIASGTTIALSGYVTGGAGDLWGTIIGYEY